jgi:hypothetical protein
VGSHPGQFELRVEERGPQAVGSFESRITLIPETSDGKPLPGKVIVARGTIVPDVEVSPAAVLLGARAVGDRCEESVTVQSLTGHPLRMKAVVVKGDGLTVEQKASPCSKAIELVVKQQVLATGAVQATIHLKVESKDGQSRSVVIPVTYQGLTQTRKKETKGGQ